MGEVAGRKNRCDLRKAACRERGGNLMEYAVLLLGIVLVAIAGLQLVGQVNAPAFDKANEGFNPGGQEDPVDPGAP